MWAKGSDPPTISNLGMGLNSMSLDNFPLQYRPGSVQLLNVPLRCGPWISYTLKIPLGCGQGPNPPQFPPWVWALTEGKSLAKKSPWHRGISMAGGISVTEGGLGGSPWWGGVSQEGLPGRGGFPWGGLPACTEADPPCGQTDTCKNITFANYVCGR